MLPNFCLFLLLLFFLFTSLNTIWLYTYPPSFPLFFKCVFIYIYNTLILNTCFYFLFFSTCNDCIQSLNKTRNVDHPNYQLPWKLCSQKTHQIVLDIAGYCWLAVHHTLFVCLPVWPRRTLFNGQYSDISESKAAASILQYGFINYRYINQFPMPEKHAVTFSMME